LLLLVEDEEEEEENDEEDDNACTIDRSATFSMVVDVAVDVGSWTCSAFARAISPDTAAGPPLLVVLVLDKKAPAGNDDFLLGIQAPWTTHTK
jgi:hypothetical protein